MSFHANNKEYLYINTNRQDKRVEDLNGECAVTTTKPQVTECDLMKKKKKTLKNS